MERTTGHARHTLRVREMSWWKRGLIFASDGRFGWNRSHAAVPTVDASHDRMWRIYYAARDEDNRSHTSYIDVEAGNPGRVFYEHPEPILPLGRPGTFDDSGIMPSWVVPVGRTIRYLYYIGWTVGRTVPYHNSIGLAISEDGGRTFAKAGEGPLFGLTLREPYFTGTSCVLIDEGTWKNWYLSCIGWEEIEGRFETPLPYQICRVSRRHPMAARRCRGDRSESTGRGGNRQGLGPSRGGPLSHVVFLSKSFRLPLESGRQLSHRLRRVGGRHPLGAEG